MARKSFYCPLVLKQKKKERERKKIVWNELETIHVMKMHDTWNGAEAKEEEKCFSSSAR